MAVESVDIAGRAGAAAGAQRIAVDAPTVTAFLGRTERGPVNEPVAVASFDEFDRIFGGHCPSSFLSHTVQHYFLNGGEAAVVVRIANGATRSTIDVPAGGSLLRLQARRPGSAEYLRVSIDYDRVEDDPERFNLVVQRLRRPGSQLVEDQELYPALSVAAGDRRFVVDALQESKLVAVLGPLPGRRPDATKPAFAGQPIPYLDMTRVGSDGREVTDYDIVGSNEEGTGLFALDRVERVNLLCIPPAPGRAIGTTAFVAAERYCERRRAMLIWDPPWDWGSPEDALTGIRAAGLASRNAFTYFPRIRPRAEFARFPEGVPASGALAGAIARGEAQRRAIAGGQLVLRPSFTIASELCERQASMLKRFGVNALMRRPGGHVVLQGNVTFVPQNACATTPQRLDDHRATIDIVGTLERGTLWVGGQLERSDVCDRAAARVREYLLALYERGVLRGDRLEQAFFVRVARHVEPAPEVLLRVGFALRRPNEFSIYEIRFTESGALTRCVPPLDPASP